MKFFVYCEKMLGLRKIFIQKFVMFWYNIVSKRDAKKQFKLLNYGYYSAEMDISIQNNNEQLQLNLYDFMVSNVETNNKSLLEIGCGRGGGIHFLSKSKKFLSLNGIDICPQSVLFCQKEYQDQENLSFIKGEAENIPFESQYFDVLLNVESSHCYSSIKNFLSEVKRVLKPQGVFLYTDFRPKSKLTHLEQLIANSGLKIVSHHNITSQIVKALDIDHERKKNLVNSLFPKWIQAPINDFVGLKGSYTYKKFKSDKWVYFYYVLSN